MIALLYLHRRFFARALSNYPSDIIHCPFGPSVLAIFRSAGTYIALMRDLCAVQPEVPLRFVYVVIYFVLFYLLNGYAFQNILE